MYSKFNIKPNQQINKCKSLVKREFLVKNKSVCKVKKL